MKKLIAVVAIAAGLMLGSVANAAQVDLFLTHTGGGNWDLTVNNNGGVNVGAVNVLVSTNLNAMTLNALNLGISPGDSSLTVEPVPGFNFVIISNGSPATTIAAAGAQNVLLATLSSGAPGSVFMIGSEVELGSDTVFDNNLVAIADYSVTVVPEPAAMVLVGLGLAAFGLIRRSA